LATLSAIFLQAHLATLIIINRFDLERRRSEQQQLDRRSVREVRANMIPKTG
jgi:hypothetical protein